MPLADFLTDTCTVLLQRRAQDEAGGPSREPYAEVQARVPCLVREQGGTTDRRQGKAVQESDATLYFDPADLSTPLTARHRLIVDGSAPRTFVPVNTTDFNRMGRLLAVRCTEHVARGS